MKTLVFCVVFLLANVSIAGEKIKAGDEIKAKTLNESVFHIGSIQQSILTEGQFQTQAGTCWVIMQGQSITGTDLATATGTTTLPDARGRFLRVVGGNSAGLGQTQEDEIASHRHNSGVTTGQNPGSTSSYLPRKSDGVSPQTGYTSYEGGVETRPVNLTVNTFIKVSYDCN